MLRIERPARRQTKGHLEPHELQNPPHAGTGRHDGELAPAAARLEGQAYEHADAGGVDLGHGGQIDPDPTSRVGRGERRPGVPLGAVSEHQPPRRDEYHAVRVNALREKKA